MKELSKKNKTKSNRKLKYHWKIDVELILTDLKLLLEEDYLAEIRKCEGKLTVYFDNGQQFEIAVTEKGEDTY